MDLDREKILYIVIAAIILIGGFFIYRQQLALQTLKSGESVQPQDSKQSFNQAEETTKQAMASTQINGVVKEVGGNFLIIEAALIDVSKLGSFDFSKPSLLPSLKKDYKVFINENTAIVSDYGAPLKFSDIKNGFPAQAFSDSEIYAKDRFTATRVNVFTQ